VAEGSFALTPTPLPEGEGLKMTFRNVMKEKLAEVLSEK